ncbi:MAG: DUF402 domain-containing protein [Actinomycetota bacterium]
MRPVRRFVPGDAIALREIWHGRLGAARPATVVRDDDDLQMFYISPGIRWYGPDRPRPWVRLKAPGAHWTLTELEWTSTHVLSFAWPGAGHAVLHLWSEDWTPRHWYVNVEQPLRRFEAGFDTSDHDLDAVIEPDRSSWQWKDEDHVATGIRVGAYTQEDAAAFRRECERGVRRILDREPPFDREWASWRPDPSWRSPELPAEWDRLEG